MILNELEWLSKIFNDTKRRAVSLRQLSFLFFCWRWSDFDKISQTGAEWHVDCGDMVKMETRCRIPIRRTFGRIPWHVCPEPPATLQGAATWWIHCYDSRAIRHIAGCSHLAKSMSWSCHIEGCNNSIRYIENSFSPYFLMQFGLWRARLSYRLRYTCLTMKNNVTLDRLCVTRGYWKWHFSTARIRSRTFSFSIVTMAISCIVCEIKRDIGRIS